MLRSQKPIRPKIFFLLKGFSLTDLRISFVVVKCFSNNMFYLVLGLAAACKSYCQVSCSVLNAAGSCYRACGCEEQEDVVVDWVLRENYKEFVAGVVNGTDCCLERYEECVDGLENEITGCAVREHCEILVDFQYLTGRVPPILWMAVRPAVLDKFYLEQQDFIYKNFDLCQKACLGKHLEVRQKEKDFLGYEKCISGCEERLYEDIDGNCAFNCFSKCTGKGDKCFEECLVDDCGIIDGEKPEKKVGEYKLKYISKPKEEL